MTNPTDPAAANAATTFHEEAMMKSLASIRETLAGIDAPADLCGGEVVAYRYVHHDYMGRKVSRYGVHPERVNGHDPIETHPLYAKPQQPAAEGGLGIPRDVQAAVSRIQARFNPHYGIDGATDSLQLAADCKALIAALSSRSATPEVSGEELVELAKAFIADYKMNLSCWPYEKALRVAAHRVLGPAMPTPAAIRAETTAQVVAWLHAEKATLASASQKEAVGHYARRIANGDHLTGGGE